jgi:cell division protein FtsN
VAKKNPFLWNALVIITVVVGGIATVMIVKREKFFPTLYGSHQTTHVEVDSADIKSEPVTTEPEVSKTETQQAATESQPELPSIQGGANGGSGEYVLVAGSFLTQQYAEIFQGRIRDQVPGASPELRPLSIDGSTYYRVVVQHSASWQQIAAFKNKLTGEGFSAHWVYREQ